MTSYDVMKAAVQGSTTAKPESPSPSYEVMRNAVLKSGVVPSPEVANIRVRNPYKPTPVPPLDMAGAIIRGAGEGLVQGARDLGVTAGKSIVGVGETAVGLVDIASAPVQAIFSKLSTGRVQLGQVGKLLEDIGVDFKTTQDFLSTLYSDEQKQALQNVSDKKSAKEKLVALGANPTVPIHSVLQSIPSMLLAARVAEPLAKAGMVEWLAGALGEGAVQAGSAQEQFRQQSDTGYTTPKQTSLAVASGLVNAAISAASGKISEKIGLEDVESIGASGSSRGSNLEFWRKLVGGMFMEGPVEEGFQSSTEKIAENLALGRPWDEGVEGAYTEGSVSGAIIGAAANALPSKGKSKTSPTLDADAWIKANADMLPTIAAKEKLSRNDWQKLGLPRVPEAERAAFLQKVKDTVNGVAPAPVKEPPQTVQEQDTPEPEAVVSEEAKPAKAPVPEAKAAVDEVQAELDAQTAEEDADEAAYALFGKREAKRPVPEATATPVEPVAPAPTDTAAEVVKPVEAPVVAEAKAVEERKKGKRVPKATKPVNKGKGVVEPVVDAPVVKESLSTPVEQPTTREVKTGLKGQTKTVPVEIPTNGEPTTTIVGRMDMVEFERMGYEPDEVTRQNWVDLQRAERRRLGQREEGDNPNAPWAEYEEFHRDSVKRALAKGDVVDERVLADYPELQTREVKTGRKGVTKKKAGLISVSRPAAPQDAATGTRADVAASVGELPSAENVTRKKKPAELMSPEDRVRNKQELSYGDVWNVMPPAIRGVVTTHLHDGLRSDALKKWDEIPQDRRERYKKFIPDQHDPNGYSYVPPGYVREGDRYVFKGESSSPTAPTAPPQKAATDTQAAQSPGATMSAETRPAGQPEAAKVRGAGVSVEDAYKSGMDVKTIAKTFGVDYTAVAKQLEKAGLISVSRPAAPQDAATGTRADVAASVGELPSAENVTRKKKPAELMTPEERAASVTPEQYIEMALRQAGIEPDEAGGMADRDRSIVTSNAEEAHATLLDDMVKQGKPLNAEAVETYYLEIDDVVDGKRIYKLNIPPGYVREGDRYVFKGESSSPTAPTAPPQKAATDTQAAQSPGEDSSPKVAKATPDVASPVKVETAEASAKEGALPKPKPNPALASSVAKAKAEGNDIELVDTVSDLPSDIRSQLPSDTSNIEGFYVNGKTYIIGENVTPDRAEAVVREEMAHRKLDTAQGEKLIDEFKKRMTEKDRKALIKEGYTKIQGESDADYEARLANEFIAKQARKNTSAWTEFVDRVKAFLESVGVRDLTSEEAARVILRKLRVGAATGKGVRYSLREQDAAYMDAVESGDIATAQRMVDEAAKKAGYTIKAYHGTDAYDPIRVFKRGKTGYLGPGIYLTDSEKYAQGYADKSGYGGKVYSVFAKALNPLRVSDLADPGREILEASSGRKGTYDNRLKNQSNATFIIKSADIKNLESKGYDSIILKGKRSTDAEYMMFSPNQIKSADPVTYDDAGNVIPLSERFNADSNDIRYSLTPAAELDEAKYESAKGIFGPKLERVGEAEFRKWVSEKLPDSAMPYAERFLSERSAMATVPKKKFVTGISRKVVDAELESMGQTPSEGGGQPSWPQLMAQAKADIKANSSAGDSLVANLIKNPRPLTAEEIALLNHVKVQRWNERDAAYKSGDKNRLEVAEARMEEVYFVSALGPDKSKSMMGGALNALKMMTDEKYELVNLVQSHYATTGDVAKPGSQVYKDLEAIAQQYKERTEFLERENTRLQEEYTTMSQSLADALRQAAYNQGKPKSKGKSKAAKIASVADVISKKSRDYGISLIEQARKEQAALNMRASAGVDPARLLMLSKFAAGHILLGVSDVAAKVSEFYGSKITSAEMAQIMSEANKIVLDARNRFAKEAESETLASRVIPKGKGAKTATQLSEVSLKDMFREQAENGVKTFKEALPLVGKLVRDSGINATDLQIQDTYSGYINEPGVLSTDTIKKVIAAYRQEAQLLSKINDAKKGVRPHKIGVPRFPLSQEARALEKKLDDLMKNVTFSGDKKPTDIASPLDAKKTWMQNEIDDMEKAIALHEERFQGKKGITDQGDIEYQRLKAQLEDVRKRYAEAFPKKPLTQEEQLAILIKQEEKNVERWNKRVADAKSGKFKSYERVQRPYSERLAELQYQRDNAKAEVARLYELQNPGKRAREAQMRRDLAAIKEMERRMAAGDYTTPTKTTMDLSGDPDAMAAHLAREQTKKTYEQYKARAAWNKLTPGRKLLIVAKNLLMSDKALVYSGDDSYPGRQGWTFALTHPKKWFKTLKRGLSAASSKNSAQIIQEIKENELYKSGVLKAAGLNINVKDATGQYESKDDANLKFANKIPVYGAVTRVSGRMFGATANLQRLEFLTTILEGSKFGRKILADPYHRTDAQNEFLKHVGWGVNVFTGFAGNNIIKPGLMLGAPNWVFSVLLNLGQIPVFNALVDGDWKAAAALEKQYGRFYLATAALIAAMSLLPSGPKDDEGKRKRNRVVLDPRSNRVGIGYVPYTSIQMNAFGPLAPWIRFVGMNVTGQKIVGGEIVNLRNSFLWTHTEEQKAKGVPWKGEQWREDLRFLRSKFRPLVTTAMGLRDGLSYDGRETPRLRLLFEAYQPLTPLHFIENLVRVPPEQAAAETLMEFFGFDSKPDFNTPQYKKYEAKMKVVDEMFKLKFKDEDGKSFGDRAEDIYIANAMKTLHRATDTDSSPGLQESAKMIIDDLGMDACLVLLYHQARAKSLSMGSTKEPTERTKDGNLTAYGKRVQRLWLIYAQ